MALNAALAINKACFDTGVSIGLDYGQILVIKEQDCYGDSVNVALNWAKILPQKMRFLPLKDRVKRPSDTVGVELIGAHLILD
ncbi:MAG: hypothetical protein IPG70_08850 [Moraxellaceae bacterium]|nr:hypothetical protein [Moraxellaceae bacterium]